MEKIIAACGLDCATCDARKATISDDNNLRIRTAESWSSQFNASVTADMINCTGCMQEGVKFGHCLECEIRNCATSRNYTSCAGCDKLDSCAIVQNIHQYVPEALINLKSLMS